MKFIEVNLLLNESVSLLVNIALCIDIYRKKDGNSTQLSFGNDYVLSVIETPEEILNLMNN